MYTSLSLSIHIYIYIYMYIRNHRLYSIYQYAAEAMRMGALLPATPGHNSRAVGSPGP